MLYGVRPNCKGAIIQNYINFAREYVRLRSCTYVSKTAAKTSLKRLSGSSRLRQLTPLVINRNYSRVKYWRNE